MAKSNLEKIAEFLLKEKIMAVHPQHSAEKDVLTIETKTHTIILTLERFSFLSLKDYGTGVPGGRAY